MKKLVTILFICFCNLIYAQSPGLVVRLNLDSIKTGSVRYKIEMKICEPLKKSARNDYFTNDSSTIDFKKLTEKEITCRDYIDNEEEVYPYYHFKYSNQVFAWEKIIIWKITNVSSRGVVDPMYIILPVKIKSFITFIEVNDVEFDDGKFIWLDEKGEMTADKRQHLSVSLKNREGVDVKKSSLRAILN